ncbi:MAG TPA: hypothetical protein PK957_04585 [Candidatus Dojkabacteria bacterium]|nr:hypothetical protein [Candidatus Dojkabacteria bacterium]HQF36656.1 hypothetical protein [Candidatus Dojkabacteria bacterium]
MDKEFIERRRKLQIKLYGSTFWDFSAPYNCICLGETCTQNDESLALSDSITIALEKDGCNFVVVEGDQRLGKSLEVAKAVAELGLSGKKVMVVYGRDELKGEPNCDRYVMEQLGLETYHTQETSYFDPDGKGIPEYILNEIGEDTIIVLNEATNPFILELMKTGINLFCAQNDERRENYHTRFEMVLNNNYLLNYWENTYYPNTIEPILARGGKIAFITPYQFAPLVRTVLSQVTRACAQHIIDNKLSNEIPIFTVNRWSDEQLAQLIDSVFDFEGVSNIETKKSQLIRLCKGSPWLINELATTINEGHVLNRPVKISKAFFYSPDGNNPVLDMFIFTCYNTLKLYNLLTGEFIEERNEYPTASELKTKLLVFRQEVIDFFECEKCYAGLWDLNCALFERYYAHNADTTAVWEQTLGMLTVMKSCDTH